MELIDPTSEYILVFLLIPSEHDGQFVALMKSLIYWFQQQYLNIILFCVCVGHLGEPFDTIRNQEGSWIVLALVFKGHFKNRVSFQVEKKPLLTPIFFVCFWQQTISAFRKYIDYGTLSIQIFHKTPLPVFFEGFSGNQKKGILYILHQYSHN